MENQIDDIELRSESVQEILERIPVNLVKLTITIIFSIIIILVVLTCFLSYPDKITSEIIITTNVPPVPIVVRSDGKIDKIFVNNGEYVLQDEILAIIKNPVNINHLNILKKKLKKMNLYLSEEINENQIIELIANKQLELGIIQDEYAQFAKKHRELNNYIGLSIYPEKIKSINKIIQKHNKLSKQLKIESSILKEKVELTTSQNKRDSMLFDKKLISIIEMEESNNDFLQKYYIYESSISKLVRNDIKIAELEHSVNDLIVRSKEQRQGLINNLNNSIEILSGSISLWESIYVLKSPVNGTVSFTNYKSENQFVLNGQRLMTVLSEEPGELAGYLNLVSDRSGIVSIGQDVNIKFNGFPYMEYGSVKGSVEELSSVKENGCYIVKVKLLNGLTTNYGKELEFRHEMLGSAEIITENVNLMKKIINPLRYLVKKQQEGLAMNE